MDLSSSSKSFFEVFSWGNCSLLLLMGMSSLGALLDFWIKHSSDHLFAQIVVFQRVTAVSIEAIIAAGGLNDGGGLHNNF